ncbi:MAG: hypothetical protein KDE20_02520, partial [Caldilineaceae bacterium]|nr:hypothetical protein [Caldilineaceae bacterium]
IERPAYEQALADAKQAVVGDDKLGDEEKVDKMAEGVLPAARRLQQRVNVTSDEAALEALLPQFAFLPDEARTFLLTGEYNIRTLPDHLDFSTSVVSYAKAVEQTLGERLFERFRTESGATDADCANKFLQAFMRNEKHLTLGSMSIILQSSKEVALRSFAGRSFAHAESSIFGDDGVAGLLNDEASLALRNRAAHDEVLSREDAQTARAWALAILARV